MTLDSITKKRVNKAEHACRVMRSTLQEKDQEIEERNHHIKLLQTDNWGSFVTGLILGGGTMFMVSLSLHSFC